MSAPQIPNLLLGRGASRGRGRGRSRGGEGSSNLGSTNSINRGDIAIQATDTDAAVSRLSAVNLGYLVDPFARFFVDGDGTRRLPIINRGTYTRTFALDKLISAFLDSTDVERSSTPTKDTGSHRAAIKRSQIISLGAGTDTRYFRLRGQNRHHSLVYHEFDFPKVCEAKRKVVESNAALFCGDDRVFHCGTSFVPARWGLGSPESSQAHYYCHPLDLRNLASSQDPSLFENIRPDLPTLVISECCLCYLTVSAAWDVLRWFSDRLPHLGVILYEPVGVDDSFGQMMIENLAARGISMPTVQKYRTLEDQRARLGGLGLGSGQIHGGVEVSSVDRIWDEWVSKTEKTRLDQLEGLDELEEWTLLAKHYAVAWGWRGNIGFDAPD